MPGIIEKNIWWTLKLIETLFIHKIKKNWKAFFTLFLILELIQNL